MYNRTTAIGPVRTEIIIQPLDFPPVPREAPAQQSEQLTDLKNHTGRPTIQAITSAVNIPFVECFKFSQPVNRGVIVVKNIPFSTDRQDILSFMGRGAKVLNDREEPVHIILDRVSSKTQDAYVEVDTPEEAQRLVTKFQRAAEMGKPPRIGTRTVDVLESDMNELMKALFPATTKTVLWVRGEPLPVDDSPWPWENFKGFITIDEMTMLVKYVENPQRAAFSQDCPQRPYEAMISTLRKLPWYKSRYITIQQRHAVYLACVKLIGLLKDTVEKDPDHAKLNTKLLNRLVTAGMGCAGFSAVQKDNIAFESGIDDEQARQFNQPPFADEWRHFYTLVPRPGTPFDLIEFYIQLIRDATCATVERLPLKRKLELEKKAQVTNDYFGYFWVEVGYPTGQAFDRMTLEQASALEWAAVDAVLRRALHGGSAPEAYFDSRLEEDHQQQHQQRRLTVGM
ncbi:hypothetical protein F4780DRAFT_790309 [Xylariomycetidae sp. FL0641]|nr:hypothetical protein F4780DRAFT_790309 [Xylariomycetidae sp. FL0641]